ncbi:MAG: aspartate--tRNA(Asn) ligase [Candidatus Nealsonbacteria bacterium]|nr:aspartate--tRNA(Asn) ligase [Candidatus Nealsonbacteria bacterium]
MKRILIKDTVNSVGDSIKVSGWVNVVRAHGKILFVDLRDISGMLQVVFTPDNENVYKLAKELRGEWVVEIIGKINKRPEKMVNPKIETGKIEMQAEDIKILSEAETSPIPISEEGVEEADLDKRMDWRWLDLRKSEKRMIFEVWTTMEKAFIDYCVKNNFIEIHSPKTLVTSTESGSELFEIKYFGKKAFLAQSPQLYKQMAMAAGFEKVFEIGPVFRANPSFTSRHDTEFTMYDVEISFIESHHDLMAIEEEMMQSMLKEIKEKHGDKIKRYFNTDVVIPKIPFPKLTLSEAKSILKKLKIPNERGDDLSPEEERAICDYIKEKEGHEFVFIHEWPAKVRAFYSMRMESDPKITKAFDLLYKGLEITSGAQREHRYKQLAKQIKEQGLPLKPFESYLSFFKYGCPPHGGFAPGPSRMLMKILNLQNVREVTYLYRGVKRLTP